MSQANADVETLVKLHWREVHSMLAAVTRSRSVADDLAQEVFLLAWRKGVGPGPGMRLWLREVARRLALNELRKRRPRPLAPSDLEALAPAASAPRSGVEDFDERLDALRGCLAELDRPERELLAGRYTDGRRLAEIADAAGQSIGYVKQRLFRVRKRLAECVKRRTRASGVTRA